MGSIITKQRVINELQKNYKLKGVEAEFIEDYVYRFTTTSNIEFAKNTKSGNYGILVDGKFWTDGLYAYFPEYSKDRYPISKYLHIINKHEPFIIKSASKTTKRNHSSFLIFDIKIGPYVITCSLESYAFNHNITLKPKYKTIDGLSRSKSM